MSNAKSFVVDAADEGCRLDVFLTRHLPQLSRTKIRDAITAGQVQVEQRNAKPSYKILPGETVTCDIEPSTHEGPVPENIPLDIIHSDDDIAVINKPPGMVVHPSKGHWQGTLTSALAYHFGELSSVGGGQRPGIVHRLDRDTSGVIVVAKNDAAHMHLAKQFEQREVEKEYFAIVSPPPDRERDWIDQPIGPHPYQREKMAIRHRHPSSRDARTFYEVNERFGRFATVNVFPKTGRTHQIRVHFQHIRCPIIADKLYSGQSRVTRQDLGIQTGDKEEVLLDRQALHAKRLKIKHPVTGQDLEFSAPIPQDIQSLIEILQSLG